MVLHVSSSAPTDICGRNSSGMLPARWVSDFLHARLSLTMKVYYDHSTSAAGQHNILHYIEELHECANITCVYAQN